MHLKQFVCYSISQQNLSNQSSPGTKQLYWNRSAMNFKSSWSNLATQVYITRSGPMRAYLKCEPLQNRAEWDQISCMRTIIKATEPTNARFPPLPKGSKQTNQHICTKKIRQQRVRGSWPVCKEIKTNVNQNQVWGDHKLKTTSESNRQSRRRKGKQTQRIKTKTSVKQTGQKVKKNQTTHDN